MKINRRNREEIGTKRHRNAVIAAKTCAEHLLQARGSLAYLLAVYWGEGDGKVPPNFIVSAEIQASYLSDDELRKFYVTRRIGKRPVYGLIQKGESNDNGDGEL